MSKTFNLGSASDMRRFERELMKSVQKEVTNSLHSEYFDVQCPHCNCTFPARSGSNICPVCRNTVELNLNINFK